MIDELETVVLTHDVAGYDLKEGDIGVVVHRYTEPSAFEVEFVTGEGRTIAVLTLTDGDVRPLRSGEILHVRELASA